MAHDRDAASRRDETLDLPASSGAAGKRSRSERLPVQRRAVDEQATAAPATAAPATAVPDDPFALHLLAERGLTGTAQALPHQGAIQQSFGGHDVSGVRAFVGGPAATASRELGAQAYATGDATAFAATPDLHTAAHEAAHVVQQRGGGQLRGGLGQVGDVYEQHADAVADLVVSGRSAEATLDQLAPTGARADAPAIQRRAEPAPAPTETGAPAGPVVDVSNIQIEPWELVTPNSVEQHKFALFGHSNAYTVFISDPNLPTQVRAIADRRAEKYLADNPGTADPEAWKAEKSRKQYRRLTDKWVDYAGRVMYERSVGEAALDKLAKAEKKLVASIKKEPLADQQKQVAKLRAEHTEAFKPELQRIKERFILTAEEEFKFEFETQNARGHAMARRGNDFEDAEAAGGATVGGEGDVAKSVMAFAEELKQNTSTDIYTYKSHSWGRYSIDCEPRIKKDDNGWYQHDPLVKWFAAVDKAAKATKVDWNALYTNFDAAKAVNETLGKKHVHFQWEHGPAPYVNHVHLDIRPDESHKKDP